MGIRSPRRWLIATLILIAIVARFLGGDSDGPAAAVRPSFETAPAKSAENASTITNVAMIPERLELRMIEPVIEDSFAIKSWAPPLPPASPMKAEPKPKPVVMTPPKPAVPVLPFSYLGRLEEDGEILFFLAAGEKNFTARVGQELYGNYRLESVAGNVLTFTYLPSNVVQTLMFDAKN